MSFFTSSREKKLWLWALAVLAAIFSTLFLGQPLEQLFSSQDFRAVIFVLVMFLVGVTIILHGIKTNPGKIEISIIIGIAAVYIMFILRLGMPERSHLMEYSVLAIFIHKAILERTSQGKHIPLPALLSIVITFLIGGIDESLQIIIPDRVFDPEDIIFNGFAGLMAIGSYKLITWVSKLRRKS